MHKPMNPTTADDYYEIMSMTIYNIWVSDTVIDPVFATFRIKIPMIIQYMV